MLQTVVASDVPALYGSLLLRSSSVAVFLSLTAGIPCSVVQAETIGDWKINPSTGTVEVLLPEGSSPRVSVSNLPPRLIVDLPNTEIGVDVTERYETGVVRQVSLTQSNRNQATLIVEFAPGVVVDAKDLDLRQVGVDNLWVLRPTLETLPPEEPATPVAQATTPQPQSSTATPQTATAENPVDEVIREITSRQTPPPASTQTSQTTTADPVQDAIREVTTRRNPPQPLTRPFDPGLTVSPTFEPPRNNSVDLLRVPVRQPNQVQVLPSATTLPSPQSNVILTPPTSPRSVAASVPQPLPYGQSFPPAFNPVVVPQNTQFIGADPLARSIPFGEPLQSYPPNQGFFDQRTPTVLLPSGTKLTVLFPTDNRLRLSPRPDRQEVLLLQGGVVDSLGNFIIPPDTPIVGRFETSSKGSRFIATAINLEGRSIPIIGQSNWIPGSLDVSPERVAIGSGIGGLGVFLVSGFSGIGLLAGAIGGAAVGVATSPEPTTLQPGQQIEIQLSQDLTTTTFLVGNQ